MLAQKDVKVLDKKNKSNNFLRLLLIFFFINIFILEDGYSKEESLLSTIWDVEIGMNWSDIPIKDFMFFACGTNGGPPGKPLKNKFADYLLCDVDQYNLREVYFEYDDEAYYWALAFNDTHSSSFQGTRVFSHLSIISVLFDEHGTVKGIKVVTDDRASHNHRKGAPGLFLKLEGVFGDDQWDCKDFDPGEGEIPVGESFMKKICIKEQYDKTIFIRGDYYRKKGQTAFDRATKRHTTGYFESRTRLEVYSADINIDINNYEWNK